MKGTNLKKLRKSHKLNQKDTAKILGMSQTGYSKYETGENDIPTKVLITLADYYDTSIDYVLAVAEDPTPYGNKTSSEEV